MSRRTIRIRLDAKRDRPWLRQGFRHSNLPLWARENRGDLVWAALTLAKAWVAEGRPSGATTLGMFEAWAKVTGGVLVVAGIDGFLANLDEVYEQADAEGAAVRSFLGAWWARHRNADMTVAQLAELLTSADVIIDLEAKSEHGQKVRLGQLLAKIRDCHYEIDGKLLKVEHAGTKQRAALWKLVAGESGESSESVLCHPTPNSMKISALTAAPDTHDTHQTHGAVASGARSVAPDANGAPNLVAVPWG